jgi:hypothetical protein
LVCFFSFNHLPLFEVKTIKRGRAEGEKERMIKGQIEELIDGGLGKDIGWC